jgi:transposase
MAVRYVVTLTEPERNELQELISKNKANRHTIVNAFILLKADKASSWSNQAISQAYQVSTKKVEQVKKRFVEEGYEAALYRKPVTNMHRRKMTGEEEAHLIALCCSEPPPGYATWTLRLLADKMVECHLVDSLSHETVRQTLKKMKLSLGKSESGVFHRNKTPRLSARWKKY